MRHSETSLRLDPPSASRGGAEAVRAATAPLPSGWICLRNSNISGLLSQPVQIHYVLLHPDVGMALLDVAPAVTPDAEAVLRQRLAAVRFEAIFQGYLPIVYRSILPGEVSAIDGILAEAFAALPPLTLAGGDAWVTVLQRALSPRNPARAAAPSATPGPPPALQARPPQAEPSPDPAREPPPRRAAPEEAVPPRATEPEDVSEPPDDAGAEPSPAPRRPRPGIWLAAGLGAAVAISALAAVMSGGDRPAATAEEAMPPAPAAAAVAPLPDPRPGQPDADTGTAAGAAPAMPLVAGIPPDPATPSRSDAPPAAPAPAKAPPVAAVAPLPPPPQPAPPPARPAPVPGGIADAPSPPARPAAGSQEILPRVAVRTPANMRKGPGNSYAVLRVTRRGEVFQVHGHALGGWVEVGDDQPQGWIHSSLLTELTP